MTRRPVVAVIGGSTCTTAKAAEAHQVGRLLAQEGCMVVCGGRSGIMKAVCEGAFNEGGFTIGILPGMSEDSQNPYLSLAIPSNLGGARNPLIVQTGQVVIAIGGSYGTLSEIGHAVRMGREVIGLDTWRIDPPGSVRDVVIHVQSAEDAVAQAITELRKVEKR